MAVQPEIFPYFEHVAGRLDLPREIRLEIRVTAATSAADEEWV